MTWKGLPDSTRNWIALGGAIVGVLGAVYGFGAKPTADLTAQVRSNTVAVESNTRRIDKSEAKVDRVICLLLLPDSLSAIESERHCP